MYVTTKKFDLQDFTSVTILMFPLFIKIRFKYKHYHVIMVVAF